MFIFHKSCITYEFLKRWYSYNFPLYNYVWCAKQFMYVLCWSAWVSKNETEEETVGKGEKNMDVDGEKRTRNIFFNHKVEMSENLQHKNKIGDLGKVGGHIWNVRDQFCLRYGNKCQTKTHFPFINKFTSINWVQWNYCCCCFYWFFLFFSISKHSAFAFSIILNRMLSLFWWWRNTHTHILWTYSTQ